MSELLKPLLAGLVTVAGAAAIGYWVIKPISRYHGIRSRIIEDCDFYTQVIDPAGLDDESLKLQRRVESNRRNAAALSACLLELPEWYLSSLHRRGHTPEGVPSDLIGLSYTTDEDVARQKMNRIKNCLGLKTKDDPNNSSAPSVTKKILTLVVMLGLDVDPEKVVALYDERSKKLVAGQEYLKRQKYQEARAAFEAGLQHNPADVMTLSTRRPQCGTRQDRQQAFPKWSVPAPGEAVRRVCPPWNGRIMSHHSRAAAPASDERRLPRTWDVSTHGAA